MLTFVFASGQDPVTESIVAMAKCDEGYRCDVCGEDVENITDSDLYLRYVIGQVDPETLHTAHERHLRCNPTLSQYIVDAAFGPVTAEETFDKALLDPEFVREQEELVTRGWRRLSEVAGKDLPIQQYPLEEFRAKYAD